MEQFFQVGIITSAHGVRGEVKVYPTTDDVKRFRRLKKVIIRKPADGSPQKTDDEETFEIESVKFFKQFAILKFK